METAEHNNSSLKSDTRPIIVHRVHLRLTILKYLLILRIVDITDIKGAVGIVNLEKFFTLIQRQKVFPKLCHIMSNVLKCFL